MDEDVIICRCEEITKREIIKAIESGARTITGVKRRTRAGMGLCEGKYCRRLVAHIIAQTTGQKVSDIVPATFRPPVRPVKLGIFSKEE